MGAGLIQHLSMKLWIGPEFCGDPIYWLPTFGHIVVEQIEPITFGPLRHGRLTFSLFQATRWFGIFSCYPQPFRASTSQPVPGRSSLQPYCRRDRTYWYVVGDWLESIPRFRLT